MLSSVLPGIRHVRAPLAAGFVWLVALWFLLEPGWDRKSGAGGLIGSSNRLMETLNVLGQGAVLSFGAYLLGSFSVLLFSRPLRSLFATSIEPGVHVLDGLSQPGRESLTQVAIDGRQRLEAALLLSGVGVDEVLLMAPFPESTASKMVPAPNPKFKSIANLFGPLFRAQFRRNESRDSLMLSSDRAGAPRPEERQERVIAQRVLHDLPVVANAQLLGPQPDVFSAVDRSQAEVEFRVALAPSLLGVSAAVAVVAMPNNIPVAILAVLVGTFGGMGLILDAARQQREANELILSLMEHGRIDSPSVQRAESIALGMADQAPAKVIGRQAEKTARTIRQFISDLESIVESGSYPMLEQARKASALAHNEARNLDTLLGSNLPSPASSPPAENVLQPLDQALSGWFAINRSLFEQTGFPEGVPDPLENWVAGIPSADELRQLTAEGKARNIALADIVRKAVKEIASREAQPVSPAT